MPPPKLSTILWRLLEAQFSELDLEKLKNHTACQKCEKKGNDRNLTVYYPNWQSLNRSHENLKKLPKYRIQRALKKSAGDYQLILHNRLVKDIIENYQNLDYQVLCKQCARELKIEELWTEIESIEITLRKLKQNLKSILSHGSKEEIKKLCEWISPNISNRIRKIPPPIRKIWAVFSALGSRFYQNPISKPYIKEWMIRWIPLLAEGSFISTEIGISISHTIYKLDIPELNAQFLPVLFKSNINLFRFFRTLNTSIINSEILPYLIKMSQASSNEPKIKISLQSFLATKQPDYYAEIIRTLPQFPLPLSSQIVKELFLYAEYPKIFKILSDTIEEISTQSEKFQESLLHDLQERMNQSKTQQATIQTQKTNEKTLLMQATQQIHKLHRDWKKKTGPSPYRMSQLQKSIIDTRYNSIITTHIQNYRSELEKYFLKHKKPLIAFDIEEWHNRVFCILGIHIQTDLTFSIQLISVEDIYPINRSHNQLIARMREWLQNIPSTQVISHGTNQTEASIIQKAGHFQINTQDILHEVRLELVEYAHSLKGEGLGHFEHYLDFKRLSCGMLKHDFTGNTFFDLAEVSLDRLLSKEKLPICAICGLEQDVLLYCLEDAFSSLLIYVIFSNHHPEICKHLGYHLFE